MKKYPKLIFGALLAALVMAAPLVAQAGPGGHGGYGMHGGYGPGMYGGGWFDTLAPEKQQAASAMFEEHRDKMHALQEQIWLKQTTLDALSNNSKTEPKELTALIEDIGRLRQQMFTERKVFADRVEKELGIRTPRGMRGGFGHNGFHGRMEGRHGGGFGRGCAW